VPNISRNRQYAFVQSLGSELKSESSILTTAEGSVPAIHAVKPCSIVNGHFLNGTFA
jgi:hypothetical protein